MKLKEYPASLYYSVMLRSGLIRQPVERDQVPVVVSLTSIPSRLKTLDITILSLLNQDVLPEKICLWLYKHHPWQLPQRLTKLVGAHFEIGYCDIDSSHQKLLPALKAFPKKAIITVDDDVIYPKNFIADLYNGHLAEPDQVVCQYGREISWRNRKLQPYKEWRFNRYEHKTASNLLPIGEGGVLYPPGCFNAEVFNDALYQRCAPKADDLWFKAQHHLNGRGVTTLAEFARPIPIIASQQVSLKKVNISADKNVDQWLKLCEQYPSLKELGR